MSETQTTATGSESSVQEQVDHFRASIKILRDEIGKTIVGNKEVIDGVLSCMLAGGHALLEGVPGLGKTMLVAAGVAYGFHKGYSGGSTGARQAGQLRDLEGRLTALEHTPAGERRFRAPAGVAPEELAEAIDRATGRIHTDLSGEIDRKLEVQRLSIRSLQELIAQTDRLLERVLARIEESGPADSEREERELASSFR